MATQGLGAQLPVGDGHSELLDREELRRVEHLGFGTHAQDAHGRPAAPCAATGAWACRVAQGRRVPGGKGSELWHKTARSTCWSTGAV